MRTWRRIEFRVPLAAKTPTATPLGCDVCGASSPGFWFYPHRDFRVIAGSTLFQQTKVLRAPAGDWAVCDQCAALIESKDLDGMVRKALEQAPGVTRSLAEALYAGFLDSRSGSARYSEIPLERS
jgi:hypothetical protein